MEQWIDQNLGKLAWSIVLLLIGELFGKYVIILVTLPLTILLCSTVVSLVCIEETIICIMVLHETLAIIEQVADSHTKI